MRERSLDLYPAPPATVQAAIPRPLGIALCYAGSRPCLIGMGALTIAMAGRCFATIFHLNSSVSSAFAVLAGVSVAAIFAAFPVWWDRIDR
jgi:hypothetical protein